MGPVWGKDDTCNLARGLGRVPLISGFSAILFRCCNPAMACFGSAEIELLARQLAVGTTLYVGSPASNGQGVARLEDWVEGRFETVLDVWGHCDSVPVDPFPRNGH